MCTRACTCVRVQMCLLGACSRGIGDLVDHVVLCLVLGAWPWRQTPTVAPGAGRQPWRWAPAVAPGTDPRKKLRSPLNSLATTRGALQPRCEPLRSVYLRWAQQTAASAASRGAGRRPWRWARGVAPGTGRGPLGRLWGRQPPHASALISKNRTLFVRYLHGALEK